MAESWVRVESERELREGMAVRLRPCPWCAREETFLIIDDGVVDDGPGIDCDGNLLHGSSVSFRTAGRCEMSSRARQSFEIAIPAGRLCRLALDEPAAEETERTRERERTR